MAEDYELRRERINAYNRSSDGVWLSQGGHPSEDGVNKVYVTWEEADRVTRLITAVRMLHQAELELSSL